MNDLGIIFLIIAAGGAVLFIGGLWADGQDRREARKRNRRG